MVIFVTLGWTNSALFCSAGLFLAIVLKPALWWEEARMDYPVKTTGLLLSIVNILYLAAYMPAVILGESLKKVTR